MPTLHVLGTCAAWPEAGRACCGYAIESGGEFVVLDLGHGTVSPLLKLLGNNLNQVAAVCVSHAHPDHSADLIGLARAIVLGSDVRHVPLIAPAQVISTAAAADPEDGQRVVDDAFEQVASAELTVGAFTISTAATPHYLDNLAVRVEVSGRTIVHTGDTGPHDPLARLARDADLLIAECTDRYQQSAAKPHDPGSDQFLLTAQQAGSLARAADAHHLVLSHFWPGNDRQQSALEAATTYAGPITVATEGQRLAVDRLG